MNYNQVEFLTSYGTLSQIPESSKPEIVFAGRSNVGKSSMLNKIFNRKSLARVSATPGKTATINVFTSDVLHFIDLPGYGYAKVSTGEKRRWADLIEGYLNGDRDIRVIFSLIDIRHKPTNDDLMMFDYLIDNEFPFVIVLTKADKLSKAQMAKRLEELQTEIPYADQITIIPFSSQTGIGVDEVKEIIGEIENEILEEAEENL